MHYINLEKFKQSFNEFGINSSLTEGFDTTTEKDSSTTASTDKSKDKSKNTETAAAAGAGDRRRKIVRTDDGGGHAVRRHKRDRGGGGRLGPLADGGAARRNGYAGARFPQREVSGQAVTTLI